MDRNGYPNAQGPPLSRGSENMRAGGTMTSAQQYREKAQEFLAMASEDSNPRLQVAYASMAQGYFRLADLAEKNTKNDLVYETPNSQQQPTSVT